MIRATSGSDGPLLTFNATVSGLAIYLDNFSLICLAKDDPSRRKRFVDALRNSGDLLFSVTNAAELAGPKGRSLDAVRTFLDELGPHWFPVELDPLVVVNRELAGEGPAKSCISTDFLKQYFTYRVTGYSPKSGKVIELSDHFFRLGAVVDWVGPQHESIRKGAATFDAALIDRINGYRAKFERDSPWLDRRFPALPFNASQPATFTYVNLVRTLIVEAKAYRLKKGDGLDFCHAVMASAFASVATLDKHWKRRVEGLPKPNRLAGIYYQQELDKMVTDIEVWLKQSEAPH